MIRGEDVSNPLAQDIWAVGIITCQMATGEIPYHEYDNDWAVFYHIGNGDLPQMPKSEQFSPSGVEFLMDILVQNPHQRPTASLLLSHKWLTHS